MDKAPQFYAPHEVQPASVELKNLLAGLAKAAAHLHGQRKEEAVASIAAMTDSALYMHAQALQCEKICIMEQKQVTQNLAEIIRKTGSLHFDMQKIQNHIAELNVSIEKNTVNEKELKKHLRQLSETLRAAEDEMQKHKRNLADLNDRSALRIFLSILSLGLDRAILGIKSLIEQDYVRIKMLRDDIKKYQDALKDDINHLDVARELRQKLLKDQERNRESVKALEGEMGKLHAEEKSIRLKLSAMPIITLFYGKLKILCDNVHEKITWVLDIVEELNDSQPRIIDIDASGSELVPLRTALAQMDHLLNTDTMQAALAAEAKG